MKDYYKILGFEFAKRSKILAAHIKRNYRKLVLELHPDKNNGQESPLVPEINEAYNVLHDSAARSQYDQTYKDWLVNRKHVITSGQYSILLAISKLGRAHQHLVDEVIKEKQLLPSGPETEAVIKKLSQLLENLRAVVQLLCRGLSKVVKISESLASPPEDEVLTPEAPKSESARSATYPLLTGSSSSTEQSPFNPHLNNFLFIAGKTSKPDTGHQQSQFFEPPRPNPQEETKLICEAMETLIGANEKLRLFDDSVLNGNINLINKSISDLYSITSEFDHAFAKAKKLIKQSSPEALSQNALYHELGSMLRHPQNIVLAFHFLIVVVILLEKFKPKRSSHDGRQINLGNLAHDDFNNTLAKIANFRDTFVTPNVEEILELAPNVHHALRCFTETFFEATTQPDYGIQIAWFVRVIQPDPSKSARLLAAVQMLGKFNSREDSLESTDFDLPDPFLQKEIIRVEMKQKLLPKLAASSNDTKFLALLKFNFFSVEDKVQGLYFYRNREILGLIEEWLRNKKQTPECISKLLKNTLQDTNLRVDELSEKLRLKIDALYNACHKQIEERTEAQWSFNNTF